jgi:transposase InsO family protein
LKAWTWRSSNELNDWLIVYNERRPHDALGGLPPTIFREQQTAKNSTYELST